MKPRSAAFWIRELGLKPHPEGGYFREVYRAKTRIKNRAACTAIYFLLKDKEISAFHRLNSDEIWYWQQGGAVEIFKISPRGKLSKTLLGPDVKRGEELLAVIPAKTWFSARVHKENSFTLVSCSVSPGFTFEDFEMGKREKLKRRYPKHKAVIQNLSF